MQKSNINPAILQPMLESAANAAEKGQSQFFTPHGFARHLAQALPPRTRPAIVDLNCGAGWLLQASALADTEALLGSDIDPGRSRPEAPGADGGPAPRRTTLPLNRITCDLTKLYPLLKEIAFDADLFVLNPPWRLWWYRDRLADLAQSDLPAVRAAFAVLEDGAARKGTVDGTIDSTLATLLIALDLSTYLAEGLLIGNNATLERLLFAPGAPYAAVAKHIWAHVVVPGNPMTGIDDCLWEKEEQFHTGVIYFARDHDTGPEKIIWSAQWDEAASAAKNFNADRFPLPDRALRMGHELRHASAARENVVTDWNAVKEQIAAREGKAVAWPHHLWLNTGGRIQCNLSRFEEKSVKCNKREAERLFKLRGRTPMELVLQRAQRDELLHVVHRGGWKVDPELVAAVERACADYHAARAPLYPLPDIQRLGYLDEQDTIECKLDLLGRPHSEADDEAAEAPAPRLIFRAGQRYSLRTQTVNVTRRTSKFNPFTGTTEDLEHSGQELALYVSDGLLDPTAEENKLTEYCFMDAKLKADPHTKVESGKKAKWQEADTVAIDFTLQELAAHFVIPEVPDVAAANPEGYRQHLAMLGEIERLTAALA